LTPLLISPRLGLLDERAANGHVRHNMWLLELEGQSSFKARLVLGFTCLWSLLFLLAWSAIRLPALKPAAVWDIRNRLVSAAHGTFAYFVALYALTFWRDFGLENTPLENFLVSGTLGYFLYDTVCMLSLSLYDSFILVHHLAVVVGLSASLLTNMGGAEITWGYIITEGSNAFLHSKEITRDLGLKDTKLYLTVELGFFATYYFGRFAVGVPGVFWIVTSATTPLLVKSVAFLLEVQSFEWGYRMQKVMRKRYAETQQRAIRGITLQWLVPAKV